MNEAHGTPTKAQRGHQLAGVFGANRDSGGFGGDVRLPPPKTDADVGKGEGRGIVYAVADHHDTAAFLELSNVVRLIFRQNFRIISVDVHFPGDVLGDLCRISGEHDDLVDPVAAHLVERLFHLRANGIVDGDDAQELLIASDVNAARCNNFLTDRIDPCNAGLLHEFSTANEDITALICTKIRHPCLHPAGDDRLR